MIGLRTKRVLTAVATYTGILLVTLLILDLILRALGLFPPAYDAGDPDLGWRPARATSQIETDRCVEYSTNESISYTRNEDGVRTTVSRADTAAGQLQVRIGVTGDSQTDLCAPNDLLHSGVLGAELASHGVPAIVLSYGAGRYSPLQAYLAFKKVLTPYHPQVLVLNIYTGNDLYDMLRADDRPHFVASDTGYAIAPPVWYSLDDPDRPPRSRVLHVLRNLADRIGLRGLYQRAVELRRMGKQQGAGVSTILAYMSALWRARESTIGYPDAFTAQMLNQQLFFHFFPGGEAESMRRMDALMSLVREENPDLILVMSPLPSYELVGAEPSDSTLARILSRLPLTYDGGRAQEQALYEQLRGLAAARGWLFVDNLAALRDYQGSAPLYNDFDYHLLPRASAIIGNAQAEVLLPRLNSYAR